ncbi:AAA family ATPase [bacterium]|nr:AAA family ATPase [bacterium]
MSIGGLGPIAQKAQSALQALSQAGGLREQSTVGDQHLADLVQESSDPLEQSLCRVSGDAISASGLSGRVAIHQATFGALSKGVTGSTGGVLAAVALDAMSRSGDLKDQSSLATYFLLGVEQESLAANERVVGGESVRLMNNLGSYSSRVAVARSACDALTTGVGGALGGVMAGWGLDSLAALNQNEFKDRANTGYHFLDLLTQNGSSSEQVLGQAALQAYNDASTYTSRIVVAEKTLEAVQSGASGPTGPALAKLGLATVADFGSSEFKDRSLVSDQFLSQIEQQGSSPEQLVCSVARQACQQGSSYGTRIGIANAALRAVANGVSGSPGLTLANLANDSLNQIQSNEWKDLSNVANTFLQYLETHGSSQENLVAGSALQAANQADSYGARVFVAREAINAIRSGLNIDNGIELAQQGLQCSNGISRSEFKNRSLISSAYLSSLEQAGNPVQQALAAAAQQACNQVDTYGVRIAVAEAAFEDIIGRSHANIGEALASTALAALSKSGGQEYKNKANLAASFLSSIESSGNGSQRQVASLIQSACQQADNYGARLATSEAALQMLSVPSSASWEEQLAAATSSGLSQLSSDPANQSRVGSFVVRELASQTSDAALRLRAETVRDEVDSERDRSKQVRLLMAFLNQLGPVVASTPPSVAPAPIPVAVASAPAPQPAPPSTPAPAAVAEPSAPAPAAVDIPAAPEPKAQVNQEVLELWGQRLDQRLADCMGSGSIPTPAELAQAALPVVWPEMQAILQKDEGSDSELTKHWALGALPPLKFGETFPPYASTSPAYASPESKQQIERMSGVEQPAEQADLDLLRRTLAALNPAMLADLNKKGYSFTVTRDRLSNADQRLEGRMDGGALADMHDGAHILEAGQKPRILVRSYWQDGRLQLDPASVLREIGKAYDQVIEGSGSKPSHLQSELADACAAEVTRLPSRFNTQADFMGEAFARFHLDRERLEREMPLTAAALSQRSHAKHLVQNQVLAELQVPVPPVVNVHPDPIAELNAQESLNRIRRTRGLPPVAYVYQIESEPQHNAGALVSHLGQALRLARSPGIPRFGGEDVNLRLAPATFNDPKALQKALDRMVQAGRGGFVVLDDLKQIPADSPGFAVLNEYMERFGGQTPVALQGSKSDLERLRGCVSTGVHKHFRTEPLTAAMITELVAQTARLEGYDVSSEALAAIGSRAKDGELGQSFSFWRAIKSAQTERDKTLLPYLSLTPQAVRRVLTTDVNSARLSLDRDPLQELERMVGLTAAKRELTSVLAQVKLQRQQEEHGMDPDRPRLNLLFEGNPGTGKTTVAKLFADALSRVGYLKNNKFKEVRVQDLVSGKPEENVKKLFEENKGSVIFVDEMHQLKDTAEGRLAFRAMIPYLGHPEYADTVFVGAGYKGEMRDLIRDVDDGAERRFTQVPFEDYSREELGAILDKLAQDKQRQLDPQTREAALQGLERQRRRMKNFGNAGSVASVLDGAIKKQTTRLSESSEPITKEAMMALAPDDFALPARITPAEVWAEINALEGLDQLKADLRTICQSIEYDREVGNDPLESFEPYFILDGPPGTGKTTMARLIVKLMAAYDIIPEAGLSESQGADLQAGFVGQTTTKVQKLFESMWGQGGFIDEIGGIARAPEAFQTDAVKTMLRQMEEHRGRFILVVADYADRVNEFLNIDPGIARRFGHRFSLEPLSSEGAVRSLNKQLAGKELNLSEEVQCLMATRMAELQAAPGWASNGDVRKLLNSIVTQQKTAFMEARAEGRQVNPRDLLPAAVNAGFDSLMREKAAKNPGLSR